MTINMWPWHEFYNWFHSFILNIFLRVFVQYLFCQENFIGQKLVLFYFFPLLYSYKKLFKRPTLGDCFQEKVFLVNHWTQKTNRFWVHCKKRICFLVDHWTQKTNRFWVHRKKCAQLLGCYHWTQGTNVPWNSLQEVDITSWL